MNSELKNKKMRKISEMKNIVEIEKLTNKGPRVHGFAGVEAPGKAKTFKFIGFATWPILAGQGPSCPTLAKGLIITQGCSKYYFQLSIHV